MESASIFNDPDYMMTETEAAELANLSVKTLRNWRLKGGGPTYAKLGSLVRYRRRDLASWVDRNLTQSTSQERC